MRTQANQPTETQGIPSLTHDTALCTQHTIHCTLHNAHFAIPFYLRLQTPLHTTYSAIHSTYSSLHTKYSSLHTKYSALHTTFSALHTTLHCYNPEHRSASPPCNQARKLADREFQSQSQRGRAPSVRESARSHSRSVEDWPQHTWPAS